MKTKPFTAIVITVLLTSMAFALQPASAQAYTVNVLLAIDEEYKYVYGGGNPRGYSGSGYQAFQHAKGVVERGDDPFESRFSINLVCRGYKLWDSNDGIHDSRMLSECKSEIGWYPWMPYGSYIMDILIVFTAQSMDAGGYAESLGGYACIVKGGAYEDRIVQHEVSHLYWARDHKTSSDPGYYEKCIMSYRKVWIFWPFIWQYQCYLTTNWCDTCYNNIYSHRNLHSH